MSQADDTTEPTTDEDSTKAQQPRVPEKGIGIGTSDEPDTFEPEEP